MTPIPEIHEATRRVVEVLEGMEAPYAVGGAIAMAFVGHLRGTRDVDVLALVPGIRYQDFADRLERAGFRMRGPKGEASAVDARRMAESGRDLGQFQVWWGDTKVEVFVPKVPLQDSILRRRRRQELPGFSMWITTVEDLILLKMIFHRPKDLEDVRHLLAANSGSLDAAYIEEWIPKTLETSAGAELRDMIDRGGRAP